jgi:hypothetical protein
MKKQISKRTMDAMKLLLDNYKTETIMTTCPLCKIHLTTNCIFCPWTLFGHKGYHPCSRWAIKMGTTILHIRNHYPEIKHLIPKRINMLKHWIRNCEVKE